MYRRLLLSTRLLCCSALLLLFIFPAILYGQQATVIKGVVTDQTTGAPLNGATITLKGSAVATTTDADGKFSIKVNIPEGSLIVSFVNYDEKEVPVNNQRNIAITLSKHLSNLDEVVVVGYGTQKKVDVTGAVTTLDQKRLENLPNNNFLSAMEGAVPGLSISTTSASAEGNNNSFLIRGERSILASNNPLIVVDGIVYEGATSDINPSDIASINVLKDASASAIYGSRASNGVILITTKKGKTGKPVISYDGSYGVEKIANLPATLTPDQFVQFKEIREPGSITLSEQKVYDDKSFPGWINLATRTGMRTKHTLSVNGGSDKMKYYISGDYLDVKGVSVNDDFKRASLRTNLTINVTNWLTFGTNSQFSFTDRSGLPANFSGDYGAWLFNPLTTAYDAGGNLTLYPWPEDIHFHNPLEPTLAQNKDNTYGIISNNYLQIDFPFLKGLSYKLNTGVNISTHNVDTYYGVNTATGLEAKGSLDQSNGLANNYVVENILSFDRNFGKHHIFFTGLYGYEYRDSKTNSLHAEGFPNDVLTYYQAGIGLKIVPDATYTQSQLISEMARLNYSFNNRYMLTLTGRRDGFSGFGADTKFGFFPSAAAGWNIINEPFMANAKNVLSNLKLRVSYGESGNEAVDSYETLAKLESRPYVDGSTTAPGYIPFSLANPLLGWESTTTGNLGVDFGFFRGRLQGSVDAYKAKTRNLLMDRRIPAMNGVRTVTQNVGETSNYGMDLALNSINIQEKNFSWTTNANISFYRGRVDGLYYAGSGSDTANGLFIGYPIHVHYSYIYDGIFQEGDDIAGSAQPTAQPGSVKIKDLNSDGEITPEKDRTIVNTVQPSFSWGMGNTFNYQNVSLYVFIQGVEGTSRANTLNSDAGVQSGVRFNTTPKNWWTPENPTNDFYANRIDANSNNVPLYQSDAYIRVKDISLSYDFSNSILQRLKLSRFRVYLTARNLFTITKWTGLDPELDNQTGLPLQKEYQVGLNISL